MNDLENSQDSLNATISVLTGAIPNLTEEIADLNERIDDLVVGAAPPAVALGTGTWPPNVATVTLASPLESFILFNVSVIDASLTPLFTAPLVAGTVGSGGGVVASFDDADGSGTLSTDDIFTLDISTGQNATLALQWKPSDAELARIRLSPPGPLITFTSPTPVSGDDWEWSVAGVNRAEPFSAFWVTISKAGSGILYGWVDLVPGSPMVGTVSALHLNFTDVDGGGRLSAGDRFVLGNVAAGSQYQIYMYWKPTGGGELASLTIDT